MRFVFFGGKGGVGKTTCAAAAALRAAREGERVLVVSTDPAHSLGDALDLELGAEPRRVKDVPGAGELWAAELDADKALKRWLRAKEEAIRTIADRGTYLDEEDVDRFMSLSFPGVDELVGLVELQRLARQRDNDQVVVDTAPTGHTLRLLEMPDTLQRLGEVLDQMHEKHRFLASSLGGAWRGDFADEVIDEIEGEARELHELLKDP
jgi:arsenite-transporting ATPase